MDQIQIKELKIFAYHGVYPEEKKNGQNFVLDILMDCDLKKAGETDALEDTINYVEIQQKVREKMLEKSCDWIEHAAARVAEEILGYDARIRRVEVLLKKPEAPIEADFEYVAVKIVREKENEE